MSLSLSFVIPARDAAGTIGDTLASLLAQRRGDWEAIVVDDGSTDGTAAVAASTGDPRITVVRRPHEGASAARNHGVALARGEWIAFLDADDWLAPSYVERMLERAHADGADAVHCAWARVDAEGRETAPPPFDAEGNLREALARRCPFAIHACVVRRQLVQDAGGFDGELACGEDWDLWRRIAGAGARFTHVPERLAYHRVRARSASADPAVFLRDVWRVLDRDRERPPDESALAKLNTGVWALGLAIGSGSATRPVLDALATLPPGWVSGAEAADGLHTSIPAGAGLTSAGWDALWPRVEPSVGECLLTLEELFGQPGWARSALRALADAILSGPGRRPLTVGPTHGVEIDAFSPLEDLRPPAGCDRIVLRARGGAFLTTLILPVAGAVLPRGLVADSLAAAAPWPLLGEYLQVAVYPTLHINEAEGKREVRRGPLVLASGETRGLTLHDHIGWIVWLQELWGERFRDRDFYGAAEGRTAGERAASDAEVVEISEPLPVLRTDTPVDVTVRVAGTTLGTIVLAPERSRISAGRLRTAIINTFGMELCRAVVREGILGYAPDDGVPLRERLATRARRQRGDSPAWYAGTEPAVSDVVGRRQPRILGTSLSRRALLPADARDAVLAAGRACGDHLVSAAGAPGLVACDPSVLPDRTRSGPRARGTAGPTGFESLFEQQQDPWNYGTPYEQVKYAQTISLLDGRRFRRALELACAEGHFTTLLAPHVEEVLATDISPRAVARTAARCRDLPNVRTAPLDMTRDPLPARTFDLVVCSEVLYYVGGRRELRAVGRKLADALVPGGVLLTAHANLAAEEPEAAGFTWDQPFGARGITAVLRRTRGLVLVRELVTPLYRIALYEKRPRRWWPLQPAPEVRTAEHAPLTAAVASQIRWRTPRAPSADEPVLSRRVPILMYHRIAPEDEGGRSRYSLTPEAFDAQLRLLAQAGYHSIGLDAWRDAVEHRRNTLGRPIILTFDDGYADFAEHAWPRLVQYGFGATLFLVTGHVGGTSRWDGARARPLLDWDRLARLRDAGLQIGAHSHTHRPLTALPLAEVVREAAESRERIAAALGEVVPAFAYPYGDHDPVVRHLVGACGFRFGLTVRAGAAGFGDDLLDLPRFEVHAGLSLDEFRRMLA